MAAATHFQTVQKIYIAFYQRPADPAGLKYWADRIDVAGGDASAVVAAFATSPEAVALYGTIDATTIGSVVDKIYMALFNKAPDAAGKQFYVDGFNAGTFTPGTIALNILNGATGDDAVAINNKAQVANSFTQQVDGRALNDVSFGTGSSFNATYQGDADATAARDILKNVTSSPATVLNQSQVTEEIKTKIADATDPIMGQTGGQTFTLTTSATDVIVGTGGDDIIIGDWVTSGVNGTIQSSDSIDGGNGIDTLKLYSFGGGGSDLMPVTVKNVEIIDFVAPTGAGAINTAGMTGVTTLRLEQADAYTGALTTGKGQGLQLSTAATMGAALVWNAAATDTAETLTLSGFDDAGNGLTIAGAAMKTLNIVSDTAANTVTLTAPASVNKVTVSGDKMLNTSAAALAATVLTLDAAASTGGVKAIMAGATATVTGGSGADSIDVSAVAGKTTVDLGAGDDMLMMGAAALSALSAYNGGDGTDTVQFTDGSKLTTAIGKQFTGFETLSTGKGSGVYNVEAIAGITAVKVDGAITAATTIDKVTTQNVSITATIGKDLTVALKDATGKADSLTFNIGGAADVTASKIITAGIETLTVNSTTAATNAAGTNNTITVLDVTGAQTLFLSGDHALTVTGFASAGTLTKIDASALAKGFTMGAATGALVGGVYVGGAGADTLLGNAAGDTFYGAGGGDVITLGAGGASDTVVIKAGTDSQISSKAGALVVTGMDVVSTFVSGEDSIDLGNFAFAGTSQSALTNKGAIVAAVDLLALATADKAGFFNDGVANRGVAIANGGTDTYVFVDANNDGNFTAGVDAVIQLAGITTVALADFGF